MKRKLSKLLGIGLTIAMLVGLLATAAPALALSQPTVTIDATHDEISKLNPGYTFFFKTAVYLGANATITITFPAGYVVDNMSLAGVISAGQGWNNASPPAQIGATLAAPVFSGNNDARTVTVTLGAADQIGASAEVYVKLTAGLKNPANPGTYAMTVKTSTETTEVTTASVTIKEPTLGRLPGIATAYNSAGIAMAQSTFIAAVIGNAGDGGKVVVTPGVYNEVINIAANKVTIEGQAGAIIPATGSVTIAGNEVTMTGFTFESGTAAANRVTITGNKAKVENCTFEEIKNNTAVVVNAGALEAVINNNTINVGAKAGVAAAGTSEISGNTMTVKAGGVAVGVSANSTIKTNTITGSSGKGIVVTGGTVKIENNNLNTLDTAIETNTAITVKGNTIDGCGNAQAASVIKHTNVAGNSTYNNNIIKNTNAKSYVFDITGGGIVNANFNTLENTLNVKANAAAQNFTLNWWGSAAGAATSSIAATAPGTIDVKTPLGAEAAPGASAATNTVTLAGKDTAKVEINFSAAPTIAATTKLAANPVVTAPPIMGTGTVLGYWDIYVDAAAGTTATIKIYDPNVSEYTVVYYGGGLSGLWTKANYQGVNVPSGYAWFQIDGTKTPPSVPSIADMKGTPFALVNDKTLAAPSIATLDGGSPAIGAYDISVTPTFTWKAVAGAHHYEIALCEDPTFTIIEWAYNVNDPFFKSTDPLRYETTYYWRVRGVLDAGSTAFTPWAAGIFTTEAEAVVVEGTTPVVVETPKPEITVEIPPTKITVEPAPPAIPTYLLWIIVVVGAVLVIALIVLIVRTRRVA